MGWVVGRDITTCCPRGVQSADYRGRRTDWKGGREANRYPPTPIRYCHWVGAWFTAPSYGGGHGEALPLPETEVEKGAKRGSGKLATQSRNYLERVAADSGWRMGK